MNWDAIKPCRKRKMPRVTPRSSWTTAPNGSPLTPARAVEHFHHRFNLPRLQDRFPQMRLATIGPLTSQPLQRLGLTPAVIAKQPTLEGLVRGLADALGKFTVE